jgi:hypothetical protein
MNSPSWIDRFSVWWSGGVRVRILKGGPQPEGVVVGGLKMLPGDQALQLVCDLKPPARGVVHIKRSEAGQWQVTVTGPLAEENFAQRVRNTLGVP